MLVFPSQQIDGDDLDTDLKTNGLDLSFFWDNRDFFANPSKGNSLSRRDPCCLAYVDQRARSVVLRPEASTRGHEVTLTKKTDLVGLIFQIVWMFAALNLKN